MPAGHIYDDQSKLTLRLGIGLANALPVWTGHSFRPYQYGLDFRQPVPVSNQYAIFPLSRTNIPILHWGALRNDNRWSFFIGNKWNKNFFGKVQGQPWAKSDDFYHKQALSAIKIYTSGSKSSVFWPEMGNQYIGGFKGLYQYHSTPY